MTKRFLVMAAALAWPAALFGQVKVIMSGGFSAAFEELQPELTKSTGITVTTARGQSQGTGPNTIGAQLRRGVPADVVIMSREGLDDLIAEGKIVSKTDADLAQSPLGMSVRAGASKPDISSVDAFKQTLLRAKSITFPNSTTGIYMTTKLFPQLGVSDAISAKITHTGVAAVASGESEIAIQPVSELLHAPGVDFAGTIPKKIQFVSVFSAAVVVGSKQPEASKRLIAFLVSENARAAIKKSGMEPRGSRK
jgi:molybdate transport system substrate-binding protein